MRDIWGDPKRGAVPVNWTVSPVLADIGPALLAYYQETATGNDLLIAGPSGAGYTYAGSWPEKALDAYTELTGQGTLRDYRRRRPQLAAFISAGSSECWARASGGQAFLLEDRDRAPLGPPPAGRGSLCVSGPRGGDCACGLPQWFFVDGIAQSSCYCK